jgi:hypothetical protein
MAGSGHLALNKLLQTPELDAIASPYRYVEMVRNASLGPMLAHGQGSCLFLLFVRGCHRQIPASGVIFPFASLFLVWLDCFIRGCDSAV